jgi:hypothetical protein
MTETIDWSIIKSGRMEASTADMDRIVQAPLFSFSLSVDRLRSADQVFPCSGGHKPSVFSELSKEP